MDKHINCWHFAAETLRDGSPLPKAGETLPELNNIVPCSRGYHGSVKPFDALYYAPGSMVARVRLHGVIKPHGDPIDKYAASKRTSLTDYVDAAEVLLQDAKESALSVIHLWNPPRPVLDFLNRDDTKRDAARAAAEDATRAATRAAARATAKDAARAATWAAVGAAVEGATRAAAGGAAWAATRAAAESAAWDAHNDRLHKAMMRLTEAKE